MYRKRNRFDIDVEAITTQVRQEVIAQVTEEVTTKVTKDVSAKVTHDIMSYLADQGFQVRPPPSRTLVLLADGGAVVPLRAMLLQMNWSWRTFQLIQIS
jgi:hypothetical protein